MTTQYQFFCISPSDPHLINNPDYKGLGFKTEQDAQEHLHKMQMLLDQFETSSVWNKQYWTEKPQPWIIQTTLNPST